VVYLQQSNKSLQVLQVYIISCKSVKSVKGIGNSHTGLLGVLYLTHTKLAN